jgi:hypothetical protein
VTAQVSSDSIEGWRSFLAHERKRLGFVREPFREGRVLANPRREDFEEDDAVQRPLPGSVNRAHATLADEAQAFELRKRAGHLLRYGGNERGSPAFTLAVPSGPMSTPMRSPAFISHSGKSPSGAFGDTSLAHPLEVCFVSTMRAFTIIDGGCCLMNDGMG